MAYKLIDDLLGYKHELYFLELARPLEIGEALMPPHTPLPIDYFRLKEQVVYLAEQQFSVLHFMEGMLKVLAMDKTFQYRDIYLEFLSKVHPEILESLYQLAVEYKERKEYLHALLIFKGLLQVFEDDEKVLYLYGCTAMDYALAATELDKQNHLETVGKLIFEKMVKEDLGRPYAFYQLGFIYNNLKQYKKAIEAFNSALALIFEDEIRDDILEQLSPLEDKEHYQKGIDQMAEQNWQQALNHFLPLAQRYDDWWMLFLSVGTCYRHLEKFEEAHLYLRKARAYTAEDIDILMELALLHRQWGNPLEARDLLAKALSREPQNTGVIAEFASLLISIGEKELAARFIKEGLGYDSANPQLLKLGGYLS